MRRFFAAALAAALLCGAFVPGARAATDITEEFTDPNFRAAVYEAIGKASPEPIYDTDVEEVEALAIGWRGIESLAGLERLTALTYLDCAYNRLAGLPALPAGLEYLDCSYNLLTSLPALPAGLEHLNSSWNRLTSLDVTGCPLAYLDCRYNFMPNAAAVTGFAGEWDGESFLFDPQQTPAAPALAGPAGRALALGYPATSAGAFVATGNPPPTVTIASGDPEFSWDADTRRLYIAEGLPAGTYPVTLEAANGMGPPAALTFTLTVFVPPTHTVSLDANGGTVAPASITVTGGGTYGALPVPARDRHKFDGWYTAAAGGARVLPADVVNLTGDIALYAQWTPIRYVFNTEYLSTLPNWLLFILCFGWIWMWFA